MSDAARRAARAEVRRLEMEIEHADWWIGHMRLRVRQLERRKVPEGRRRLRGQVLARYAEEIEHMTNIRLALEGERNDAMDDIAGRGH